MKNEYAVYFEEETIHYFVVNGTGSRKTDCGILLDEQEKIVRADILPSMSEHPKSCPKCLSTFEETNKRHEKKREAINYWFGD